MTRKVAKNMRAVPKSPISARAQTHIAANTMNPNRFRRTNRRSSVAAPVYMYSTLTSSEGWMVNEPKFSQLPAPPRTSPSMTVMPSRPSAASAASHLTAFTRCRSLSHQPRKKNSATPMSRNSTCRNMSSGVLDAATAVPSVLRKKAMVSGSNPVRRTERMTR